MLCSLLDRARRTAELAGFGEHTVVPGLLEFDYGDYEGRTTAEIHRDRPGWDYWRDGVPHGDTLEGVGERLSPIVQSRQQNDGPTLIFSHSHAIRIFAAVWLGLAP